MRLIPTRGRSTRALEGAMYRWCRSYGPTAPTIGSYSTRPNKSDQSPGIRPSPRKSPFGSLPLAGRAGEGESPWGRHQLSTLRPRVARHRRAALVAVRQLLAKQTGRRREQCTDDRGTFGCYWLRQCWQTARPVPVLACATVLIRSGTTRRSERSPPRTGMTLLTPRYF